MRAPYDRFRFRSSTRGCSTQERRAARRELKTLAKTEAVSEEEQAKKLAELELKEQEELFHSQLSETSQVDNMKRSGRVKSTGTSVISCLSPHRLPRARRFIICRACCGAAGAMQWAQVMFSCSGSVCLTRARKERRLTR